MGAVPVPLQVNKEFIINNYVLESRSQNTLPMDGAGGAVLEPCLPSGPSFPSEPTHPDRGVPQATPRASGQEGEGPSCSTKSQETADIGPCSRGVREAGSRVAF